MLHYTNMEPCSGELHLATDLSAFDEGEPDSVRYDFGVKRKMTEHKVPLEAGSIRRDSEGPCFQILPI